MCKHLPGYPPHLGALGGWMCSILYPHMVDQCIILTLLSFQPSLLGRLLYFHTSSQTQFPPDSLNPLFHSLSVNRCYYMKRENCVRFSNTVFMWLSCKSVQF